eukprot:15365803-Ditylum_brightwellii.AAC.1
MVLFASPSMHDPQYVETVPGLHNYNVQPIAPFGIEVTVHETANQKATWGLSGVKGWYIRPTFEHYQCYKVYIPVTKGEHIAITVDFYPQSSKLQHISAAEAATHAERDLTAAINGRYINAPFAAIGDSQLYAIKQLANIFQKLTHGNSPGKPLRAEAAPKQIVSQQKKQTQSKPLPRVEQAYILHLILDDDHGILPPPKPHPITVPTPKDGPFYIPLEDYSVSPMHCYPTRSNQDQHAIFLATIN